MSNPFSHDHENSDELKATEQTLSAITPRPPRVDRDRLMFLAGAASVAERGRETGDSGQEEQVAQPRRSSWHWPAATAAFGATSLALAIVLLVRTNAPPQVVYVQRPAPADPASSPQVAIQPEHSPASQGPENDIAIAPRSTSRPAQALHVPADNYLRSRNVALQMGLDALGSPRSTGGGLSPAISYFDWLVSLEDEISQPDASAAPMLDSMLPKM